MKVILDDYLVSTERKKSKRGRRVVLDHYLVRGSRWREK